MRCRILWDSAAGAAAEPGLNYYLLEPNPHHHQPPEEPLYLSTTQVSLSHLIFFHALLLYTFDRNNLDSDQASSTHLFWAYAYAGFSHGDGG
jgi:hypothetical protein